jgi:hypothetical protein
VYVASFVAAWILTPVEFLHAVNCCKLYCYLRLAYLLKARYQLIPQGHSDTNVRLSIISRGGATGGGGLRGGGGAEAPPVGDGQPPVGDLCSFCRGSSTCLVATDFGCNIIGETLVRTDLL